MRAAEFCEEFLVRFGARESVWEFVLNLLGSFACRHISFQRGICDVDAEV